LKKEQKVEIKYFLAGKDVFVVLTTGFGKTLYFASIYDDVRKSDCCIIVVVCRLLSARPGKVDSLFLISHLQDLRQAGGHYSLLIRLK